MNESTTPDESTETTAMDRLRDRTDELELIISSLTIFALYSLPGWAFDVFADNYTHLSTQLAIAGVLGSTVLTGFCYGLGTCFVVHLMARAYWVGLIGLRAAFPKGIDWKRTPTLGQISADHYRSSIPHIDEIIAGTDRLASSVFAVISMLTLVALWFGTILVATLTLAGTLGARFGATNSTLGLAALVLLVVFGGIPILVYLLDVQLAARRPSLRNSPRFSALVIGLRKIADLAYPQRLILPVQLTLQSNTRPMVFLLALTLSGFLIVWIGNVRVAGWRDFTLSGEFTYLDDDRTQQGFRSVYYEDMASPKDRLRAAPRISSFEQSGSVVRVFIPYQPLRDNLVLDQLCADVPDDADPLDCLRSLWSVSLKEREVPMDGFVAAERADLGLRGMIGLVPLERLEPGLHRIEIVWNPDPDQDSQTLDDRYTTSTTRYSIPFAFAPAYEQSLD